MYLADTELCKMCWNVVVQGFEVLVCVQDLGCEYLQHALSVIHYGQLLLHLECMASTTGYS